MPFQSFQKDPKGTYRQEIRDRKARQKAEEQRIMGLAKKRDGGCRWPHCDCRTKGYQIDPAHRRHRGMGGNPDGDRTRRELILSLCRPKHNLWDAGLIDIIPRTSQDFDGPADFYVKDKETGEFMHVFSERLIGVSSAVGR